MTRTNAREIAIQMIFQLGFSTESATELLERQMTKEHFAQVGEECYLYRQFPNKKQGDYIRNLVEGAFLHSPEMDDYISRYAKGWTFARIPRVIAAMMRVAMYEAMYMDEIPVKVAINDGLEIAKGYDDQDVISFANGILGSFLRNECSQSTIIKPETLVEEVFEEEEVLEESPEVTQEETEEPPILSMNLEIGDATEETVH